MWKKRFRFTRLLVTAFIKRYYKFFLLSVFLGIAFFWFWPRISHRIPKVRTTHAVGIIGRYDEQNLPDFIINKVSIGLTQIDETGQPFPGLATTWSTSENGQIWTFELDSNLTWSDGTPIRAADIQYQYEDVQTELVSDTSIRYSLPETYAPFPAVMSKPIFKDGKGIGPYKITKVQRQGQALKLLEFYPTTRTSMLPSVTYRFYNTEEQAILGFKLGEIDEILELNDPGDIADWPNVTITEQIKKNRYTAIFFNLQGTVPDLQEKQVRQGLAYAIKDKSFGQPRVLSTIPDTNWAYNPNVKTYDYDLERAKQFLESDNTQALKLTITTFNELLPTAERIAQDWLEVNVQAEIAVVNTIPETFDVLLATQEVPNDPDQYALWHSTQAGSRLNYQNPKIDKLLEDGRKVIDQTERKVIYQDFQRFLNEDLPVVFLYHPSTYTITRK